MKRKNQMQAQPFFANKQLPVMIIPLGVNLKQRKIQMYR